MTYEEALTYIHSVIWRGKRIGLGRITELLRKMGNPEKELKFVHVAGTNGKGSTASMTASILKEAGYHTGLFISPFIHVFNERMQIDGEMISDEELVEITGYVRSLAEQMEDKPTEFELITALAMEYFKRNCCEIVVLEVGLGGEMDSTNVIPTPEVAVITALGLDHTKELGDTIQDIARAKAGIIKEGGQVVFYGQNPEAQVIVEDTAKRKHCQLTTPDYSQIREGEKSLSGQIFSYKEYDDLQISLLGTYQLYNACVVIETIEALRRQGWEISDGAIRFGLEESQWTGRLEKIHDQPLIFVDGSHNPYGIKATAASLRTYFPQGGITFLVGVLADKDAIHMMEELPDMASSFV
ncbi:MAG: bifunctional folylpolyglutamate synthase/dihydrofolate synthase, partial [Lachnospiraceae bacterium]|nr:bifunctional folylpolyglutamate synthase/dihydrofolate synthase [Lachnospiraceae bacterium]